MAEQPNRDERMVLLARFSTASEAEMVRELLSQNDIACVVQGGNYGALEPLPRLGGFSEIRLLVLQNELSHWSYTKPSSLAVKTLFEMMRTPVPMSSSKRRPMKQGGNCCKTAFHAIVRSGPTCRLSP